MGRPLHKRLFGANSLNNLKVQFWNGSASVPGFIVRQVGSKRFLCEDVNGTRRLCRMVDKASEAIGFREMTFTVKYDNGDIAHPTKISAHLVTVENAREHWTFDPSTTDGYVQIEEAGTDTSLTGNTNLEEDADTNLVDLPAPGSGELLTSLNVDTGSVGTPIDKSSQGFSSINNAVLGLWREKFAGNAGIPVEGHEFYPLPSPGEDIDPTFLDGKRPGAFGKPDVYVSFGDQDTPNEDFYMFEWKGYFKASGGGPGTAEYNFWTDSDDDMIMWIGDAAVSGFTVANSHVSGSNAQVKNANSVTLNKEWYYPVRIWFNEYSGFEKSLLWWAYAGDGGAHLGNDIVNENGWDVWWHSTNGTGALKGFDPA
jgi:hypothetical protein